MRAKPGKRFIDKGIVTPRLDPPHLTQYGRGMAAFTARKFTQRTAALGMGEIPSRRLWQPGGRGFRRFDAIHV
ncbi:hypothetical protein GCM10008966_26210 [Rhodovulum strictum]